MMVYHVGGFGSFWLSSNILQKSQQFFKLGETLGNSGKTWHLPLPFLLVSNNSEGCRQTKNDSSSTNSHRLSASLTHWGVEAPKYVSAYTYICILYTYAHIDKWTKGQILNYMRMTLDLLDTCHTPQLMMEKKGKILCKTSNRSSRVSTRSEMKPKSKMGWRYQLAKTRGAGKYPNLSECKGQGFEYENWF